MAAKPSLFAILLRALGQVTFALAHGSFGRVCAGGGAFLPISGWGARREPGRGRFGRIPPLFFPEKNAEKGWEGREGREIFLKNLFLKKPPLFRTLQITIFKIINLWEKPRCVVPFSIFSQMSILTLIRVLGLTPSQMCTSISNFRLRNCSVPDVRFQKSPLPRCHVPKTQMSQMCG